MDDEVDIAVKETVLTPETPLLTEDGIALIPEEQVIVEQVDVQEKIVFAEKHVPFWKILLWGTPSARRPWTSALTFLINLALIALTADALYRARWFYPADDISFVRLGYVSHSEAKFLIREPDQAIMPLTLEIRPKSDHSSLDYPMWQTAGDVKLTTTEADFTSVTTVSLKHSQQGAYEWRTSNNHTGEFLVPPQPGKMPEYNGGKFTFLSTSCILPRFPYNPFDHPLAIPGLRHLARRLPELGAHFMLFLGDFIYVDVPQRFGKSVEEYQMQYRQIYASPDWASVAQNLSWIHTIDDHELENDFDASSAPEIYTNAIEPWYTYQGNANPPQTLGTNNRSPQLPKPTWYEFAQGPASFFMMDTRSFRSRNNIPAEEPQKTMLGSEQLEDLLAWLARPEPVGVKWKIIASSVPFTKNWPVNRKDTWGGFLAERKVILEAMWNVHAQGYGVVVLSGDRHEFAATKFPPPAESQWPESAAVHEFSTSPLNQFASPLPTYQQADDEDIMLK